MELSLLFTKIGRNFETEEQKRTHHLTSFPFPRVDDDDNDDDDELFLRNGWPKKGVKSYFQPGLLSEILTIANLWYTANRILTCAEPGFRLCWMKLDSSNNHYTTAPQFSCVPEYTRLTIEWKEIQYERKNTKEKRNVKMITTQVKAFSRKI